VPVGTATVPAQSPEASKLLAEALATVTSALFLKEMVVRVEPDGQGVTESALITVPGGPDDGVVVRVPDGGAFTKAKILPPPPTAQPWLASTKDTPARSLLVPEVWALQVPAANTW